MMLRQYTLHLNRSGGIFSILVGCCRMCVPPVSALPSVVASMRSDYSTAEVVAQARRIRPAWPITNRKGSQPMVTVPRQRMLSAHEDCSERAQGVETKLESDGSMTKATLEMIVSSPQQMEETGAFLAADSGGGDVVLLSGDLGTGKTCFARGFVRARVGDPDLSVTSPSYLLDNTYQVDDEAVTLHHMDLYRLGGDFDLGVLDIPRVLETSVCLIEWPDRLGTTQPANRLGINDGICLTIKSGATSERSVFQMFTWKHKTKTNEQSPSLDTDFGGQGLWMT